MPSTAFFKNQRACQPPGKASVQPFPAGRFLNVQEETFVQAQKHFFWTVMGRPVLFA